MTKSEIIEVLSHWNFWNRDLEAGKLRKEYVEKLFQFLHLDKIVCLTGIRRSGKSTLLRQLAQKLIQQGIDRNRLLIVNLEEPAFENGDLSLLQNIYQAFLEIIKPKEKPYLFLDEIQNIEKWEKFVRSLQEKKEAYILITGSSSKLLSQELASLLTGRRLSLEILPLTFSEFLHFQGIEIKEEKDFLLQSLRIKRFFREYMEWGGFPEVVLTKEEEFKRRILLSYYEDILTRDIVVRFRVKNLEKLKSLAYFYLTNISSPISFRKISRFIKLSVETVRRFSSHIETAGLIFFIKRFSFSVKEQENSPRKVYSVDPGLSNCVGFRFSSNLGRLMENLVALRLRKQQIEDPSVEVYYWKDTTGKKEIDFLLKKGTHIKRILQVAWNIEDPQTKEREVTSLIKALEKFNLKEGIIITEDKEGEEKIKEKRISFHPLWKWLLEKQII